MNIGNLTAVLGLDMSQFEKNLAHGVSKMHQAGQQMQSVGKKMSMFVTAPLVGLGIASVKTSMQFESSMSKIIGLVGVAEDEVNAWNDEVLRMAGEVGRAPAELADALFFVTSAGIQGAEAMQVLEMSAKASAAGLGETKVVADLLTSAMNAYGSDVLNASQATDILVAAVREGKAEAPALAQSMGSVLPIASEMGLGFDQVGAAIAAMTRTGTDAATASTQLRGILAGLLKPTKQAEDALAGMGMSSAELRSQLREKGLVSVLGTLKQNMEGNEEAMAQVFGNVRALTGVFDIMGANAEDNVKIFERMTNSTGALDKAFDAASKTTGFKWNQAMAKSKAALTTLGMELQKAVIPLLERLVGIVEGLGKWFAELDDGTKRFVLALAAMAAATGPLLYGFGSMLKMMPTLVSGLNSMVGGFTRLRAIMLANPYTAAAAAITALAVGLYQWHKRANAIVDVQGRVNESVASATVEINKQKREMNYLFSELKNANKGTDRRRELVDRLNTEYRQYLPYLLKESSTLGEIEIAQRAANNELSRTILLKSKQEAMEAELTKVQDKQVKAITNISDVMTDRLGRSLNETNDSIAEYIRRLQQGENLYGALQRSFRNHGQVLNFAKKDIEDLAKSVQDEQRVFTEFENKYKSLLDALGTPLSTAGGGIDLEIDPLGDSGEDAEEFAEDWISAFEYIGIRMDKLRKEISETLAVDPAADVSNQVEEYHRLREELEEIEKAFEKQAEAEEKSINSRNAQLENLLQSLMTYEEQAIHVWDNQHKLLTDAWMSGEISLEQYMETLKRVDNAYAETMGRMKTGTDKVGDAVEQLGRLMASVFVRCF